MNGADLGICPELSQIRPQFDIHLFESLPSTNTHLWEMLKADMQTKVKAGTVVIAQQQSAGRGQRDRSWQSAPGGLYLSLAIEPDWPVARSAQLTCFSAWGIATALGNLGVPIQVKWPNDLFYNGEKLGGILTETRLSQSSALLSTALAEREAAEATVRIKQAVIGVGLNWHNLVPQTGTTLTRILDSGLHGHAKTKINCLETLIVIVLRGILQGYFYQQQVGSQVFMKTYGKLLTQVGKTVSVKKGRVVPASAFDLNSVGSDSAVSGLDTRHSDTESLEAKYSGRVIGISEEGYLEVAARQAAQGERILRIKPDEIRI
ncbi:MAG: biotin--[acetyl-CoA-carboxylase] ligase [Cyanobacteria bacterium P01_D01_bin.1]